MKELPDSDQIEEISPKYAGNIFPEYFVRTNKKDPISGVTERGFLH